MNSDPRLQIHRRRSAIERLRTLTTGAAVAGLAGTAGFGVLAAATWSGNVSAATSITAAGTIGTSDDNGTGPTRIDQGFGAATGPAANGAAATARPRPAAAPRVHATTGGSH